MEEEKEVPETGEEEPDLSELIQAAEELRLKSAAEKQNAPKEQEEKIPATEPNLVQSSRFLKWLDNYWYHYKWRTLLVVFLFVTALICLIQCGTREKSDLTVTYAGNRTILTEDEQKAFRAALNTVLTEDIDGDNEKNVLFVNHSFFSEDELKEQSKYYDSQKNEYCIDGPTYSGLKNQNLQEYETLSTYLKTGDCALWLVSPALYRELNLEKFSMSETGIAGEVRLGDTEFYQCFEAVRVLPGDTLVVLTNNYFTKTEVFGAGDVMYRSIVDFKKSK